MTLRQQENARLSFSSSRFTGRGMLRLNIGRKTYEIEKVSKADVDASNTRQRAVPVRICRINGWNYWTFQDRIYAENEDLNPRQIHALLVTRQRRRAQQIDRAEQIVTMDRRPRQAVRGHIPEDVKQFVFTRDRGRCRNCGSTTELQFDHVIPVSQGGSSSPENLQVLCGPCNRRKSGSVTLR